MARIRKEFEQRIATDLDDMTRLHEIGIQCARADGDLNTCLENILDAAIEITWADKGNVQLFDSDSGALRIAVHTNFEQPFLDFFAHVRREEAAACGAAMQAGGRVLVEDVTQSDIFAGQPSLHVLLAAGVRAVQATPLLSSSGAVLGMISTHFSDPHRPDARALRLMDLLARQAADYLERKQAESALQQAQAQLQAIFDDVPFGVYLVDSDLRIRSVNPTALPVFGDIPDLIGRDFTEVIHRLWPRAYAEEVVRRFRHTLGTGEPYYAPEVAEKRRDRGITEYYEWRINRVALPEGRNGVVCYFRDVSAQVLARHALADAGLDLKRLNAQLEARVNQEVAAREEAQAHLAHAQRMEALGQLAGGIAHDFNNVLQAVHGGASLIERRPGEPDSVSRLARLVVEAAGRGSAITRRLLAFSRRGDLRAEAVDPVSLLSDMREILVHTLGTGITVRVETDPALPPLWADKGQVETVLVNLAANARDAMAGKGVLTLRAAAETVKHGGGAVRPRSLRTGDYICLSVTDTGTGMPPEVLARVTEPFFTTKEQGKGTGLGLAMARGFAEQSDGGLHIESALGRGTTVTLSLPVAGGMEAAARPPEEEAVPDGKRHTRVLVVDDDPIVREIVTNQLEMAGYTVLSAPDGAAALAVLDTGTKIDLLISDLSMPGMDGLSLLREGRRRRPKLAVILLTGFATNAAEIAIGGATGGGFTLLRKPVTAHQLAERVEMLLEGAAIAEGNATH
jgi:PAS domain S-box-containing protein